MSAMTAASLSSATLSTMVSKLFVPLSKSQISTLSLAKKVYVGKLLCTVIDKDLVLADECVCYHRFNSRSNDWNTSELKAFIESEEFADQIDFFEVKIRNTSADICSLFEDLLESFDLTIPSSDRTGAADEARLFGEQYSDLEDSVTDMLVSLCEQIKKHPTCVINSEEY